MINVLGLRLPANLGPLGSEGSSLPLPFIPVSNIGGYFITNMKKRPNFFIERVREANERAVSTM